MNRNQVIQNLYKLQQHSIIFDVEIRVALNLAILELSGEGRAEMPEKVRAVLDKMEKDTRRLTKGLDGQQFLELEKDKHDH